MAVLKKEIKSDFTVVHNKFLRDKKLSINARGLLMTMLSMSNNWNFSIKGLASILPDGERKISSTLKELEENGYLIRKRKYEKGKIADWEYIFSDEPMRSNAPVWANELHAKDTSKKVRAVKKMQAERGERLGGRPPYGYRKKAPDSKEIVPSEETAPVVQRIFQLCASGKGPNQIARILTEEQILTPANYAYQKMGLAHNHVDITRPYDWSGSSVTGILDNKVYLGHTVGLRSTTLSYKNKKAIQKPENEQIMVENTHPALITQELWDIVQDVRQHKKRIPKQMEEPNIFSGLAFCADCGKLRIRMESYSGRHIVPHSRKNGAAEYLRPACRISADCFGRY